MVLCTIYRYITGQVQIYDLKPVLKNRYPILFTTTLMKNSKLFLDILHNHIQINNIERKHDILSVPAVYSV